MTRPGVDEHGAEAADHRGLTDQGEANDEAVGVSGGGDGRVNSAHGLDGHHADCQAATVKNQDKSL